MQWYISVNTQSNTHPISANTTENSSSHDNSSFENRRHQSNSLTILTIYVIFFKSFMLFQYFLANLSTFADDDNMDTNTDSTMST